jgi:hypothetical protein
MVAKKTAARKKPEAKTAKTKPAVKATAPKAAKAVPKPVAKSKSAVKTAAPNTVTPEKAPAAAAARAKPAPSASFDPDRRRELIAAAAARRRKTVTARAAPSPASIIRPREASPVEQHRFSVGDEVRVVSTAGMWFKHGIDYRVTAALPPQAGKLQYRIKNDQEPYERVVSESQLASAAEARQAFI